MIKRETPIFRRLRSDESIIEFDCGKQYKELNDFIINDAHHYAEAMLAVTYIVEESGNTTAYFSMANDRIGIEDFDSNNQFNRFRRHSYENSKRIKHYPAVKLCRFAVNSNFKHKGLGTKLLNLIKYFFFEDPKSGCRYITVDARCDAVDFYEKNGFRRLYETKDSTDINTVVVDETDETDETVLMYYDLIALKTI